MVILNSNPQRDIVLFDLDGTLLDTSEGIFNSVRYAEKKLSLSPISDSSLKCFVGPPPCDMYMEMYGLDKETAIKATQYHREYGIKKGIYEAKKYLDIEFVLERVKKAGYKIGVSTLKKQNVAEAILDHMKLIQLFDVVVGMNAEETYTKKDTICIAMKSAGRVNAVMIGDSIYDYEGAIAAKVQFIGVLYGFGFVENVEYSFYTVKQPKDILIALGID